MCGRYHLNKLPKEIQDTFPPDWNWNFPGDLIPRYNIAPGTRCLVVRNTEGGPEFTEMLWRFQRDDSGKRQPPFNARSETMDTKWPWKLSFHHKQRCLVIADGFYEPKGKNGGSRPWYRFHMNDDYAFAMAGLWTEYRGEAREPFNGFAIVTSEANEQVAPVHDRMPVILQTPEQYDTWFSGTALRAQRLCEPEAMPELQSYHVVDNAKNPRNEGPVCFVTANGE